MGHLTVDTSIVLQDALRWEGGAGKSGDSGRGAWNRRPYNFTSGKSF
jgi:hypothetical protein